MTCDESMRLLARRLDGRASEDDDARLEQHLGSCASCREAAAVQKDVARALASRPDAPIAPAFAERVSRRLDEPPGWFAVADWRWLSVRLAPITVLLLVAAGVVVEYERAQAAQSVSLSSAIETAATGSGDRVPVSSIVWQPDVNADSLMLTVLTAAPDATIGRQADER